MAQVLSHVPDPSRESELVLLIEAIFQQLTGTSISSSQPIYVEKYAQGGMSSGNVSPQFWRETAMPLLRSRYTRSQH